MKTPEQLVAELWIGIEPGSLLVTDPTAVVAIENLIRTDRRYFRPGLCHCTQRDLDGAIGIHDAWGYHERGNCIPTEEIKPGMRGTMGSAPVDQPPVPAVSIPPILWPTADVARIASEVTKLVTESAAATCDAMAEHRRNLAEEWRNAFQHSKIDRDEKMNRAIGAAVAAAELAIHIRGCAPDATAAPRPSSD